MLNRFRRGALCSRAALIIASVAALFTAFSLAMVLNFIIMPLAKRTTHEMASMIVLSAGTWQTLPKLQQPRFAWELLLQHGLNIEVTPPGLAPVDRHGPFMGMLRDSLLAQHVGSVEILQSTKPGEHELYWVRLGILPPGMSVRFFYGHAALEPIAALALILLAGIIAVMAASVILARLLTRPLRQLSDATRVVACGARIQPLPATGPAELSELVRSFNRMAEEIQELLANRTTLLSGISHDLRSPLARLELTLEMLEEEGNQSLIAGARRDLQQMNRLIGLFLEIGRGMQTEDPIEVDVDAMLEEIVEIFREHRAEIIWAGQPGRHLRRVHPVALRRIVTNLLENAIKYGDGKPVRVGCRPEDAALVIEIEDRGPGIPDAQRDSVFQPFHRLEQSRNSETGGHGLGLSIVRQLAESIDCKVELRAGLNGGTLAYVRLP